MEGIRGQDRMTLEAPTVDRMASSSLMEDSCALEFSSVGDGGREDEQQITQVSYLFRSFCIFF